MSATRPITESVERLARTWWPTNVATFTIDDEGRPRFRSVVTETLLPPPWQLSNEPAAPNYRGAISHTEMLAVTTPRAFNAVPLIGASADPGEIYHGMKKAWNGWQARRIRERIQKELAELEATSDVGQGGH
jgi:hypothetical protein